MTGIGARGLVLACLALACASGSSPVSVPLVSSPAEPALPASPAAPLSLKAALVDDTLQTMSRIRGLAATRAVPSVTLDREGLIASVKQHIAREVPASAIRAEGLVQKLLGLFPTEEDYEGVTYALLEGQIAGYYEPANGTMYLARDLDVANATSTLGHELVHALQDQHWDLRTRSAYVAGQEDKDSALAALAEGDATSAMGDLMQGQAHPAATALSISDQDFARALRESVASGEAARAPHALRMSLIAPYVDGVAFVNGLRRQGGWSAVDDAWAHTPETTEQILHPDKWRTREPALVVPDPPPPSEGFTRLDANTYGEQALRLTFGEWMTEGAANVAAAGWGGDRGALYEQGEGGFAFVWHVRFDEAPGATDAFAARAFTALTLVLPKLGRVAESSASTMCVERPGNGVFALHRDARDLIFTFGKVATVGGRWRSAMTCAEAIRWSRATLGTNTP